MNFDGASYKVEAGEGLRRTLHVQLPAAVMQEEFRLRLGALRRRTRIRGFRPGKAPVKLIRQRHGQGIWDELIREAIRRSLREGMRHCSLRAVGSAEIKAKRVDEGSDLTYEATFDVLPDIEWKGLDALTYEEPAVEIRPGDVDRAIDRLRRRGSEWKDVQRPARDGDRMVANMRVSRWRKTLEGGELGEVTLMLGETRLMPRIKERLMGLSVSQKQKFRLRMPPDYPDESLRGKRVLYEVEVIGLSEPELPDLDDEFVGKLGVDSGRIEDLRSSVQTALERELKSACEFHKRQALFDQLLAANEGSVPESLVGQEIEQMLLDLSAEPSSGGEGEEGTTQQDETLQETPVIRAAAEGRVRLRLLVGELAARERLGPDDQLLMKRLRALAASAEDPEAALEEFTESRGMMNRMRAGICEEQVLEWLYERAAVTRREMSLDEFMQPMPPILSGGAR